MQRCTDKFWWQKKIEDSSLLPGEIIEVMRLYELNTITNGTALHLAIKCLLYLSSQMQLSSLLGASTLREDFYLDDIMAGADNPRETLDK